MKVLDHRELIGASAELTVQTKGSKEWHKRFGLPYYGGGVLALDFLKHSDMGRPFAVYGTFGGTVNRTSTHSWNYETSAGFAFGWEPYDLKKAI